MKLNIQKFATHTPPLINGYTISETNQALILAGLDHNVFVANLSKKAINIDYQLYDSTTLLRASVYNSTNQNYLSNTLPVLMDLTQFPLYTTEDGVPIYVRITDSQNSATYYTNNGVVSGRINPDFYNYIIYTPISITNSITFAKRIGQISGRVGLNINGVYYNDVLGNISQGNTYGETQDTEFLENKNYYILDNNNYVLLEVGTDYQVGDAISEYFTTVYDTSSAYKPIIKYKYWKYGDEEPSTYGNVIPTENISVSNDTFSVSNYDIGSTIESDTNYFNPEFAYRVKVYVEDNFTNAESEELQIQVGEPVWSEYKNRVDFKKLTVQGKEVYSDVCSSEEIICGIVDDRPVYRKMLSGLFSTNSNSLSLPHGINNLDEVVSYKGWFTYNNERRFIPQFYYNGDTQYNIVLYQVNNTNAILFFGNWAKNTGADFKLVLEYTKTTD